MTDHVSDLQWDRLLAGELGLDTFSTVHVHAQSCAGCASRLRELTAERDAFALRPFRFPLRHARRRPWWLLSLVPVAAAAVMVALWPTPPRHRDTVAVQTTLAPSDSHAKGLRLSSSDGAPTLQLFAGQPGALGSVASGDAIHPGDYLQAGYSAARDGFGAVLSRDGAGSATAYVPPRGDAMVPLPAGGERSFPSSTIVDGVLGSERIAIVWCPTPHPLEPLLAALRAQGPLPVIPGCIARVIMLEKRAVSDDGAVRDFATDRK